MDTIAEMINLTDVLEQKLPEPPAALEAPQGEQLAGWIDHTLLKPEASAAQIKALCQEALQYSFASVCVNPVFVPLAVSLLQGSPVKVCTVVGFPLGAALPAYKVFETLACLGEGAAEIDMVIHVGGLKGEAYGQVLNEIQTIARLSHHQNAIIKVILEMALLTRREKIIACLLCKAAGVDFVKTSTGFGPGGATLEDVDLMFRLVGPEIKVKAAGGIRNLESALAMIRAGASRIGTSAGVQIMRDAVSSG
jgi:deoxyribose-phosphate aldolase